MDKFDVRHFNTERIGAATRLYITLQMGSKPWIDNPETVQRLMDHQPRNVNVHCAGLCLYANIIQTGLLDTKISELNAVFSVGDDEIISKLREKPKFANYTDSQMKEELEAIKKADIRNAFAHGAFGIYCPNRNPKNGVFVLEPTRSYIYAAVQDINAGRDATDNAKPLKYRIGISFESVHKLMHQYVVLQSIKALHTTNYVERAVKEHTGEAIDEFLVPTTLCSMVDKYMDPNKATPMKSLDNPVIQGYVGNALSFAELVYTQNEHHALEGKDDDLFALESYIRNSIIHGNTHLGTNGTTQTISDPGKTDYGDIIEDDLFTVSKVLELLHAQVHIFSAKIKSGEMTQDEYNSLSAQDRLRMIITEIKKLPNTDQMDDPEQ